MRALLVARTGVSLSTTRQPKHRLPRLSSGHSVAPEVIEQNGATTASDIWSVGRSVVSGLWRPILKRLSSRSVGCVVIELLEGQPPYHSLEPMQALFRIVQDDSPPIPEGASGVSSGFMSRRNGRITRLT